MKRFDRILGILLFLQGGNSVSGSELARRFNVSQRTIYRDLETLSELGVPLYSERGREGGFRLLDGYFLPPVMFSTEEASSLLMGLNLMRQLRVTPFAAQLETAERKLLHAMPERLQGVMANLKAIIGFETIPGDLFDLETVDPQWSSPEARSREGHIVRIFIEAIFEQKSLTLRYQSPYRQEEKQYRVTPQGILWDRERWYLAGIDSKHSAEIRLWRSDRVLDIHPDLISTKIKHEFHISELSGRSWLRSAMSKWTEEAPVVIRLSVAQAERLKADWYYRYARFEPTPDGQVFMTFGEDNSRFVLALLRWLGPDAELIEPRAWRALIRDELQRMLKAYPEASE